MLQTWALVSSEISPFCTLEKKISQFKIGILFKNCIAIMKQGRGWLNEFIFVLFCLFFLSLFGKHSLLLLFNLIPYLTSIALFILTSSIQLHSSLCYWCVLSQTFPLDRYKFIQFLSWHCLIKSKQRAYFFTLSQLKSWYKCKCSKYLLQLMI